MEMPVPITREHLGRKALKSTTYYNGSSFQAVVTFFTHQSGLSHSIATYRNEKVSEIHIVQFLLDRLKDMGVTMYLDAVHCQKNCRKNN